MKNLERQSTLFSQTEMNSPHALSNSSVANLAPGAGTIGRNDVLPHVLRCSMNSTVLNGWSVQGSWGAKG